MLSNAYFLAKFRFDTAENEPAKNLKNFRKMGTSSAPPDPAAHHHPPQVLGDLVATEKTAQADFRANRALEAKAERKQKRRATKLDQKRKADATAAWAQVAVAAEKQRAAESRAHGSIG